MTEWLILALWMAAPLVLLGLMVAAKTIAERQGWIVRRAVPRYAKEQEEVRVALNEAATDIGNALLPVVQRVATELSRLFPPLTRRQRLMFWLDRHWPTWFNIWSWQYWVFAAFVFFGTLLIAWVLR